MKKVLMVMVLGVIWLGLVRPIEAREGGVALSSEGVACEGVSLWKERSYRVTGRCEGLVYPYATKYGHYVLWAKTEARGDVVRVAEVNRGYFDGTVTDSFRELFLTAEESGLPRRPSNKRIVTGEVSEFSFAKDAEAAPVEAAGPEAGQEEAITVQSGTTNPAGSVAGDVIGKIVKSLLIIIGVVIALVIGTSLVFRRRGSVSGQ